MIKPRDLVPFFGGTTLVYSVVSAIVGLLSFGVELGFAYGLQAFLVLLGIAVPATLNLPGWMSQHQAPVVILAIFLLSLLRSGLMAMQTSMHHAAAERFSCRQREYILRWAFDSHGASVARISSLFGERASQAGGWVRQLLNGLNLGTMCLFLVATLFYLQPYVTLAAVAILLALLVPARQMNQTILRSGKGVVTEWDQTYRRLLLSVKNLLLLRIYGLEQAEERRTGVSLRAYLRHYLAFNTASGLLMAIPQTVGVTLVCILLLLARNNIHLSPGVLLVYFYLLVRLLQITAPVGQAFASSVFQWPQVAALYEWWKTDYLPSGAAFPRPVPDSASPISHDGPVGWHCDQIGFSYPGAAEPALQPLSFDIQPGSAIVIMGPSGSGKSTLLSLLLAELTPDAGHIDLIIGADRVPLADARPALMRLAGYVGAESFLIDGTIRENLLYGVHDAPSDAEFADALQKAQCGFIDDLASGLEHRLTDQGAGLSSGEKQRLSLARALLRRPRVLVLDEATANLDVATEEKLVDTLAELKGGMTIVAATHRPALLRLADQVLTLAP